MDSIDLPEISKRVRKRNSNDIKIRNRKINFKKRDGYITIPTYLSKA
jgi:hypothetical protein